MNRSQCTQLITISFFLLIPFIGLSQTEESSDSRFSWGVNFSLDYCYRIVSRADTDKETREAYRQSDSPQLGFHTGISGLYRFKKSLELEFGLQFSRHATQNEGEYLNFLDSSWLDFESQVDYHFLQLPIKVNYHFGNENISYYATAGLSLNYLLYATYIDELELPSGEWDVISEGTITEFIEANEFNANLLLGFGVKYQTENGIQFRIEPLFRCALASIGPNEETRRRFYSAGLQTGIYYSF